MPTAEHETRRELSGVPISLLLTAVVVAALLGIWIGSWGAGVVTVGIPVIVVVAVIAWGGLTKERTPAADAPGGQQINGRRHRVLLVADGRRGGTDPRSGAPP